MGFLLDVICAGILLLAVIRFAQKPVVSALLSLGALAAALVLSFALSAPASTLAAQPLITPSVQAGAANRLADLFSAPHLSSGRETVESLDSAELAALIEENPPAFANLLAHYGADIETLRALPDGGGNAAVLDSLTQGAVRALARSLSFAVLFTVLFLLGKLAQRRVELGSVPPPPLRGARRLTPCGIGLLAGLLAIFLLSTLLEWLAPYVGADSVIFSAETLKSARFYQILNQINLFIRL